MDAKDTLNKVRTILGLDVVLEEKLLENGTKFVAEKFEGGNEVFIATEDDEKIPVPAGEYELEDGLILVVKEDGLIDSIKEDEDDDEEMEEEIVEEEELGEDEGKDDDEVKADDWAGMEKRVKNLEDAIADLKARVGEDEKEIAEDLSKEELSKDPSLIKHNPEAKKEIELNKIGKVSGTRERVFNTIFNK